MSEGWSIYTIAYTMFSLTAFSKQHMSLTL